MSDRLVRALEELVDALRAEIQAEIVPAAPERLLDIDSAAEQLGVGRSSLYGEISSGRLRSITVGRRRLVPTSAIAEYVASRSGATADDTDHRRSA